MNWAKVARALDDEWWRCTKRSEHLRDGDLLRQTQLVAALASMLNQCLVSGMSDDERAEYEHLMAEDLAH